MRVKSQSSQTSLGLTCRVGDSFHDSFQNILDADTSFRAGKDGLLGRSLAARTLGLRL